MEYKDFVKIMKDFDEMLAAIAHDHAAIIAELTNIQEVLDKQAELATIVRQHFTEPMVKNLTGVSSLKEWLNRPGGRGDAEYVDSDSVTVDELSSVMGHITEERLTDRLVSVSIPDNVARSISEHSDAIESMMNDLMEKMKNQTDIEYIDRVMQDAIRHLSALLDITHQESKSLLKCLTIDYLRNN